MAKQKNDVNTTGRNIRWATIIIVLLIVIAGARWIVSSLTRAENQQPLLEDIYLPKYRRIFEPFCIRIGGLGDTTTPLGVYAPEDLMQWSEIYIDGEKVDRDQLDITLSPDVPRYINFCFPDGLGDGLDWQYMREMEFQLKDSWFHVIESHPWILSFDTYSYEALQDRIEGRIAFPSPLPEPLADVTRETHSHEAICITVYDQLAQWQGVSINRVKISETKISRFSRSGHKTAFCFQDGINEGRYLMEVTLKDSQLSNYQWVLIVTP
jgi:hypothetical protein